jgi:hypothetical protein
VCLVAWLALGVDVLGIEMGSIQNCVINLQRVITKKAADSWLKVFGLGETKIIVRRQNCCSPEYTLSGWDVAATRYTFNAVFDSKTKHVQLLSFLLHEFLVRRTHVFRAFLSAHLLAHVPLYARTVTPGTRITRNSMP